MAISSSELNHQYQAHTYQEIALKLFIRFILKYTVKIDSAPHEPEYSKPSLLF